MTTTKENIPLENRKLMITQAVTEIQNWMDCDVLSEAEDQLVAATTKHEALDAIKYIECCIVYRRGERPECSAIYKRNLALISTLKKEIAEIQE